MHPIFLSKKLWVSLVGLILAVLAANGVAIPDQLETQVVELIMAIVASYNVGQGVADGVSKGRTSGYSIKMGTAEK